MYKYHIPTNALQKALLTAGSGLMAIFRPQRGDMVATFGETTAPLILPSIKKRMLCDVEGARILRSHSLTTFNSKKFFPEYLRSLPEDTLGKNYSRFLDRLKTSPDERPPVQFIDNLDYVYVMQRYRESHDIYHTVLQMPTNMIGEVAVKWFEGLQFGFPMCLMGGMAGAARLGPVHREKFVSEVLPWVIRAAQESSFFMNIYWERHWEKTIPELQLHLGIPTPPHLPYKK